MDRIGQLLKESFSFSDGARTGVFIDEAFIKHDRLGHPESASRLTAIANETDPRLPKLPVKLMSFKFADFRSESVWIDSLSCVHDSDYLKALVHRLDAPDYVSESRWSPYGGPSAKEALFKAAVGASDLALAIARGNLKNGFAVVRPPGHHAGRASSEGYCALNNIAVSAKRVHETTGRPVAIVDLDVHHGNGTESIFLESSDVATISIHQDDWPYTGDDKQTGQGAGRGFNFNLSLPRGSSGESWLKAFDKFVVPAIERLQPFMMFVAMGYDTHWRDPQGSMSLSSSDQLALTSRARKLSDRICNGRLMFTLEGGYDRRATAAGIKNTLADLAGEQDQILLDPYGVLKSRNRDETQRLAERADEALLRSTKIHQF